MKVFRGFLARKNVVVVGYDESLIAKLMEQLTTFWPSDNDLALGAETDYLQGKTGLAIIAHRELEKKLRKNMNNTLPLDFDKPLKNQLKKDLLYEKLKEILDLTSEKSRKSMLESELISLNTIAHDIEKITSKTEDEIPLKDLKKRLKGKHPAEKVNYVLDVLVNEGSTVLEPVHTPAKSLEETMFFVD